MRRIFYIPIFITQLSVLQAAEDAYAQERSLALRAVKTESPRATMETFYGAMADYVEGVESGDSAKKARISDAIRCFDLTSSATISRDGKAREAAILLKEVIDRVIVLDYSLIPGEDLADGNLQRWRLKDTEISIVRISAGERAGEYLFSKDTLERAAEFFQKVRHLPYVPGGGNGAAFKQTISDAYFPDWSRKMIFEQEIYKWFLILVFFVLSLLVRSIIKFILKIVMHKTEKSKATWDNSLFEAILPSLNNLSAILVMYLGFNALGLTGSVTDILILLLQAFLSYTLVRLSYRLVNAFEEIQKNHAETLGRPEEISRILFRSARSLVIIFGTLISLQNLGINVMSLVAGLGIGGLAFALAAKDTAANLFGSIMILLDKPFQVGDWVKVSESEGTVEEIGLRSTRIRTFYDSVISVPNMDMATTRIDNMGKRAFRRITMTIGITYDSPPEKIEAFLEGIKNIILANPSTRKDYFHVVLNGFGPSSLDILLYVFVKVPSWAEELIAKQNLMLEIIRLASTLGLDFAFPTQTLHVETMPDEEQPQKRSAFQKDNLKQVAEEFSPTGKKAMPTGLGIFRPPHLS